MFTLSSGHYIGIVAALTLMTAVGLYAGRRVKSAADFTSGGRKASWFVVAGTMMGTLIGGSSTVGTAQLAFQFGFSAWWFTLGAGVGCALLGLVMVRRLYDSLVGTIPEYLVKVYGAGVGPIASVFTSLGAFFNIVGNILAYLALIGAMFRIGPNPALAIGLVFVLSYILYGGIWGAGLTGVVKVGLLYVSMISCGLTALYLLGGVSGTVATFPSFPWFSLFGRGFQKDFAAGFSLLVGVLSTQTYMQAVVSGKSVAEARKGALASAVIIPPVGLGGILVGLFMRANFPQTPSSEVFPVFVLHYLPPLLAGVVLATLMITVIATWAGLTLGISTMFIRDIYQKFVRPEAQGKEALLVQRLFIVALCATSAIVATGNTGTLILGWGFMSMGLRGCTALCPLIGAMFFPAYVTRAAGIAATLLGPMTNFVWYLVFPKGVDPLYPGLLASLLTLVVVSQFTKKKEPQEPHVGHSTFAIGAACLPTVGAVERDAAIHHEAARR